MRQIMNDIEYKHPYPVGYVGSRIRSRVSNLPVGARVQFEPQDYPGVPVRHFHNTLASVMGSEYGYANMRTLMDEHSGVIEAVRLR
jgi:hypothetical protein